MVSRRMFRLGWLGLLGFMVGCASSQEELAWQVARDSKSPSDYANYQRQYPSGAHVEDARWEAVRRADSISACVEFLRANPKSSRKGEVEEQIDALAAKPLSIPDAYAYLAYVRTEVKNPPKKTLERADQVRSRLESLEWDAARSGGQLVPLVFFLRAYPSSAHAAEAQPLILEKRFEGVQKMNRPLAYQAFLQFYPKGARSEEAAALLEKFKESSASEDAGAFDPRAALQAIAEKDPLLGRLGCSVILAGRIRKSASAFETDAWREMLSGLNDIGSPLPAECAGFPGLTLDVRDKAVASNAVRSLLHGHDALIAFAGRVKAMQKRTDLVKRSAGAADQLSQQLESDELTEGVLGSGVMGGVDLGLPEKGSATALRAKARLDQLAVAAAAHTVSAEKLLRQQAGQAEAVRFYLTSLLKTES